MPNPQNHIVEIHLADAVIDAHACFAVPGAVAVYRGQIVSSGAVDQVEKQTSSWVSSTFSDNSPQICRHKHENSILLPGFVNAHTHLDLTDIGYRDYPGSFIEWVKMIIGHRPQIQDQIVQAVEHGIQLSLKAGVLRVGDISGAIAAAETLNRSSLGGVPYLEFLGIGGETLDASLQQLDEIAAELERYAGISFQPHAPYSTGPVLYRRLLERASELGFGSVSTHLAETREEGEFTASAGGGFQTLLESLGKWEAKFLDDYGHGQSPVGWLAALYSEAGEVMDSREGDFRLPKIVAAHCNYVSDQDIRLLKMMDCSVAYCPRASRYFEHEGHRYRDMLEAGVNVCLGTDSIVSHGSLSILDEMRHLHKRDGTEPMLLLKMATMNGYRALYPERDALDVTFTAGAKPGVVKYTLKRDPGREPLKELLRADDVGIQTIVPLPSTDENH